MVVKCAPNRSGCFPRVYAYLISAVTFSSMQLILAVTVSFPCFKSLNLSSFCNKNIRIAVITKPKCSKRSEKAEHLVLIFLYHAHQLLLSSIQFILSNKT